MQTFAAQLRDRHSMAKNKNAMTRYQILDELLSNRYHNYSIGDLTDEVNRLHGRLFLTQIVRP